MYLKFKSNVFEISKRADNKTLDVLNEALSLSWQLSNEASEVVVFFCWSLISVKYWITCRYQLLGEKLLNKYTAILFPFS